MRRPGLLRVEIEGRDTLAALSCAATETVVDGVTYYGCGGQWFQRSYSGGSVNDIVVNPPN